MYRKKLIIVLLSLIFVLGLTSLYSSMPPSSQVRPLGGFRGDFKRAVEYGAGSNVIGSAGTSGRGAMSLGTGLSMMSFQEKNILPAKDIYVVPFSFSYGLTDKIDLSAAVPLMRIDEDGASTENGYADLMFGANYHYYGFFDDALKSQLSVSVILPTGQDKISGDDNKTDVVVSNYLSKKLNNRMQLDAAINILILGEGDESTVITYGVSLSRGWSKNFSSSLEFSGADLKDPVADKNNYSLYFGNRYSIPKTNMSLGLVYGTNLYSTYLKHTINTSLSYSF